MTDRPLPLDGHRCLVIGGARGLGAAIVHQIVTDGGRCHATTRQPRNSPSPRSGVPADTGPDVTWSTGDVRNPADIQRVIGEAITALGGLDALVYCAGTAPVGPVDELTPDTWDDVYRTNTRGFALAVQAALPHWRAHGSGSAVAVSSQAARRGQPLISAYTASKAALEGLIRALAVELAPHIRLNAVAPGITLTDMITADFARQAELAHTTITDIEQRALRRIPQHRFQPPTAIAAAVTYLLSPAADSITGHVLAVDGGMST